MAMLELVRGLVGGGLTVHGFRSSFFDWGHDVTGHTKELLDIALAHTVSDKVEAAYRRSDMFEKRRRLMQDWANYCERAPSAGNVVSLQATPQGHRDERNSIPVEPYDRDGRVLQWVFCDGDLVRKGDVLADIYTTTQRGVICAPCDGQFRRRIGENVTCRFGYPIAWIMEEGTGLR